MSPGFPIFYQVTYPVLLRPQPTLSLGPLPTTNRTDVSVHLLLATGRVRSGLIEDYYCELAL